MRSWEIIITTGKVVWVYTDTSVPYQLIGGKVYVWLEDWAVGIMKFKALKPGCLCYHNADIPFIVKDWVLHYN